jgi:hypothetical protein
VFETQCCLVLLEIPGEHQRHRNFHHFRWLYAGKTQWQPAFCAIDLDPEKKHGNEQDQAQQIERNRKAHQFLRRQAGDEPHDDQGNAHVSGLRKNPLIAIKGG